MRSLRVFYYLR